ncbi:DUF6261 family protein [Mangrovibacterium lignilyticum]|uniref:DUF6261 family protein n=1 Tax=Mangrovibacterium lignilyticum TaxID=2668052 RepID=UPI0013D222F7|nr:DUF6261 family protein [Mangrovibacterium lignilyticum]
MASLKKIHFNSSNAEVDVIAKELVMLYAQSDLTQMPYLPAMMGKVHEMRQQLNQAIKRLKTMSSLKQYDHERDQALAALMYFVFGLQYQPDAAINAAAGTIYKTLNNYGLSITRDNYTAESALIDSLLLDLSKPDLQPAIAQLAGCAELIEIVREKQEAFVQLQNQYSTAKAKEQSLLSATRLRRQLRKYLNGMVLVYLNAMFLVDEPLYGQFVQTVAVIVDDSNRNVKRRQGKRKERTVSNEQ